MIKVDVLNNKGKSVEKLELNESVFGVEPNTNLITQYINVYRANQRQGTSATKNRSEVHGGGRKPWKQKGTGRARAGSIRSPIWRGGGISHGPRPKSWKLSMPKKMKRAAIISTLSLKQSKNQIKILDVLEMKVPKTKDMASLLKTLKLKGKPLIVLGSPDSNILKSSNNIKKLKVSTIDSLNGFQLLRAGDVLFLKDAILKVQEKYSK